MFIQFGFLLLVSLAHGQFNVFNIPNARSNVTFCGNCEDYGVGNRSSLSFRSINAASSQGVVIAHQNFVFASFQGRLLVDDAVGVALRSYDRNGTLRWSVPYSVFNAAALVTRNISRRAVPYSTDLTLSLATGLQPSSAALIAAMRTVVFGINMTTGGIIWSRMINKGSILPIPNGAGCAPLSFLNATQSGVKCVNALTGDMVSEIVWKQNNGPKVLSGFSRYGLGTVAVGATPCGLIGIDVSTMTVVVHEWSPSDVVVDDPSMSDQVTACEESVVGPLATFNEMGFLSPDIAVLRDNVVKVVTLKEREGESIGEVETTSIPIDIGEKEREEGELEGKEYRHLTAFRYLSYRWISPWTPTDPSVPIIRTTVSDHLEDHEGDDSDESMEIRDTVVETLVTNPSNAIRDILTVSRDKIAVIFSLSLSDSLSLSPFISLVKGKPFVYPDLDAVGRERDEREGERERVRGMKYRLRDWAFSRTGMNAYGVVWGETYNATTGVSYTRSILVTVTLTPDGGNVTVLDYADTDHCTWEERERVHSIPGQKPSTLCPGVGRPCSGLGACLTCTSRNNPAVAYAKCSCLPRQTGFGCESCIEGLKNSYPGGVCSVEGASVLAVLVVFLLVFAVPPAAAYVAWRKLQELGVLSEQTTVKPTPWADKLEHKSHDTSFTNMRLHETMELSPVEKTMDQSQVETIEKFDTEKIGKNGENNNEEKNNNEENNNNEKNNHEEIGMGNDKEENHSDREKEKEKEKNDTESKSEHGKDDSSEEERNIL